ncbi:MAG TPA: GNAT family N-acetyltransferase [Gammaproteobacteria bacterium]
MKTLEAQLLQDFGAVDRGVVRRGLLAERGISGVFDGPGDYSLTIEYDPATVAGEKLVEILCRYGLSDHVVVPPADVKGRERWLEQLVDGRRALIRPVRPDDVERNAQFIKNLSPPSKHFLFLGGVSQLSAVALRRLCDPDYAHDMAYIALGLDPQTGETRDQVGVCRYAGADPVEGAEISVAVADAWQHQGLGKVLLCHLVDHARAHGVTRLYSLDAVTNSRMRKLARDVGFTEQPDPGDINQVIYSLDLRPSPSSRS